MTVFVIEITGRGIAAIGDVGIDGAENYRDDPAFREDLTVFDSGGKPIWDGESELYLREAFPEEVERWRAAQAAALRNDETEEDEEFFVWLIPIDDDGDDDLEKVETPV